MRTFALSLVALLALPLLFRPAAHADDEHEAAEEREEIAEGLEHGIEALRALGGHDEVVDHLRRILERLEREPRRRARAARRGPEHEIIERWIEIMEIGRDVVAEAERAKPAEVLEHAMHALELTLEGRRDEEAMHIRRTAPSRERQADALLLAAEIAQDQGHRRHAKALTRLGRHLQEARDAEHEHREDEGEDEKERRGLAQRVEVLRLAMPALREGEKKDAAELIERAIHTGELLLEGREDEEAQKVFRRTPDLETLSKILAVAATLWADFGNKENAKAVAGLSAYYAERAQGHEERRNKERQAEKDDADAAHARQRRADQANRLEAIQHQLHELMVEVERLRKVMGKRER